MAIKEPFLFSTCQTLAHCKRPDIRELCTEFYSTEKNGFFSAKNGYFIEHVTHLGSWFGKQFLTKLTIFLLKMSSPHCGYICAS